MRNFLGVGLARSNARRIELPMGKHFKQTQAAISKHLTNGTANYSRRCTEVPKGHAANGREQLIRRREGDVNGVFKLNSLDVATHELKTSGFP